MFSLDRLYNIMCFDLFFQRKKMKYWQNLDYTHESLGLEELSDNVKISRKFVKSGELFCQKKRIFLFT